jgi:hypothetical protein
MVPAQRWYHYVTVAVFSIPPSTLKDRLRKVKSRNQSHEKQQLLSSMEENELATWISNASKLVVPTPLLLLILLDPDVLYTQIITDRDLATTKRAFIKCLFGLTVRKQAESSLLRKDPREKEVLLDTRRTRKSGKRVILKG